MNTTEKRYASDRIKAIASEKLEALRAKYNADAGAADKKYRKLFKAHSKKAPKAVTQEEKIRAIMAGKVPLRRRGKNEERIHSVWNLDNLNNTPARAAHKKAGDKIRSQENVELSRLTAQNDAAVKKILARQTEILDELNIGDADKALELINQFKNE